jgi:hypothetical protein
LSDDGALPFKWTFPSVTIAAGQYLLVWASDKNKATVGQPLHTNFKISSSGETLSLTNKSGVLVSGSPSVVINTDVSYGRQPNGTGSWLYFDTPTPNASNTGSGSPQLLEPPTFSHKSGLYTSAINVALTTENTGAIIVYTTDGSEPELSNTSGTSFTYKNTYPYDVGDPQGPLLTETYRSKIYNSSLSISDISATADKVANKNTVQDPIHIPPTPVRKATVIKARTFVDGKGSSTVARTFFVWNGGNPYDVPVVSLQIQENNLFDYNNGIYTAGVDFDTWRAANPTNKQAFRAENNNYWRSGREWEFPTSVELFDATSLNPVMNTFGGVRIHGNNSRGEIIKNLRLYARSDYDKKNEFEHNLFNQTIPGAVANDKYKRILLRGNGSGGRIAYDVVMNRLMQPIYNGIMRIRTSVHFINGEYWGLTALRDRVDQHHFANNFDLNDENIVIVDCKVGKCELDEGLPADFTSFVAFTDFIENNDMSSSSNYQMLENMLDVDSYINHIILEIFAENDSYELKFWKTRTVENTGFGDGKWRVTIQDFEASLKSSKNWLEAYADDAGSDYQVIFGKLLANDVFKFKFINRMADILNTAFKPERFSSVVDFTFDEIAPILDEDENRAPRSRFYGSSDKANLIYWANGGIDEKTDEVYIPRSTILKGQMNTKFNIPGNLDLNLNLSDPRAGYVKLNSIDIKPSTTGVDENPYPWTGSYFQNVPVTLEAFSYPGYQFTSWSGDVSSTNKTLEITPTASMQIQANYTPITNFGQIVYFWLADGNLPNDTPLTTMNPTYNRSNQNGVLNYSSSLNGYPFTSTNANWRKASLERINAPTPLNYRDVANNDIAYNALNLRGLQIKQPFRTASLENMVAFEVSTLNYKNIKLSLAIKSDGAAQFLSIEYWNGSSWSNANISSPSLSISADYALKTFDLTNVTLANNNASLRLRLRFNGFDMSADDGKKVFINNIALEGVDTPLSVEEETFIKGLKVFPNPTDDFLKVQAGQMMEQVSLYNIFGQEVYSKRANTENLTIDMSNLSSGMYLLRIFTGNSSTSKKIIKK